MARANRRRTRLLSVAPALVSVVATLVALIPILGSTASADPAPSVADVQRQLGELALSNSQLVEQYDQAQTDLDLKTGAAQQAQQQAVRADQAFDAARVQLGLAAAAIYEGGAFSAAGALLTSRSGESYLDRLQTLSMITSHTAQIVDNLNGAKAKAETAHTSADSLLASATQKRDALAVKRKQIQGQIDKYEKTLGMLTAQQRVTYQARVNPAVSTATVEQLRVNTPKVASATAAQAVKFALAQVGKPYVFGAAGPRAYDCSGLTMAAWASAGVSLPHSAAGQYNYGTHVPFNQLQPGDLLFFYTPISHVTIYIGNGLMVSAPTEGENVSVVPAGRYGGDYVGATRLTG